MIPTLQPRDQRNLNMLQIDICILDNNDGNQENVNIFTEIANDAYCN